MTDPLFGSLSSLAFHLRASGILLLGLAVLNLLLPGYFGWRQELDAVRRLTREVFFGHLYFLVLLLALVGTLYTAAPGALLVRGHGGLTLGGAFALGGLLFWGARLGAQFLHYSPQVWRGDRFRTRMHGVFSLLWLYLTAVNAALAWRHWGSWAAGS